MKEISKEILSAAVSSNKTWCILRKEEEILEGRENDIDLFVTTNDYPDFVTQLLSRFQEQGIRVLRERRMPAGSSYLLITTRGKLETQKLDIVFENTLTFLSIIPSDLLARNIVQGEVYPVLSEAVARELSYRKEAVRKDFLGFLSHLGSSGWSKIRLPRLSLVGYVRAFQFNRRNNPGAFVVLVGPDGSGKTTVAEKLRTAAKPNFFSVGVYHFSIPTLPRLNSLLGRRGAEPDYTKPNSGTNAPIQSRKRALIYTLYYGVDLMIWSHFRLKRRLRLGQLLIFDRYIHDWMFQRSYRKVPRPAVRWLLARGVQPNLVVYLTGDSVAINARKPELSAKEVATQQAMIEESVLPFWRNSGVQTLVFDTTSLPLDQIVEEIRERLTPA